MLWVLIRSASQGISNEYPQHVFMEKLEKYLWDIPFLSGAIQNKNKNLGVFCCFFFICLLAFFFFNFFFYLFIVFHWSSKKLFEEFTIGMYGITGHQQTRQGPYQIVQILC